MAGGAESGAHATWAQHLRVLRSFSMSVQVRIGRDCLQRRPRRDLGCSSTAVNARRTKISEHGFHVDRLDKPFRPHEPNQTMAFEARTTGRPVETA
jgi:hypothetical protein